MGDIFPGAIGKVEFHQSEVIFVMFFLPKRSACR